MDESSMTMLLISDDPILIDAVGQAIRPVDGLKLQVIAAIEDVAAVGSWDGVAMVLIHLTGGGPAPEVAEFLRMLSRGRWPISTLVVAEQHDADQALTLLRMGVADYLGWPLDMARLTYLFDVLTVRARRTGSATTVEGPHQPSAERPDLAFDDGTQGTEALMDQVRRIAPQDATVLLGGETGTGKSRLARLIHELSPRRSEPFVVVNCGTLPPELIESELFGHARGAFSGAKADRPGKFAEVGAGTLFLDEIDALPMAVQARLLRAIEDRVFEPAGSAHPVPVRARLIAASNRPLDQEMAEQRFRSDLFYRINVIGFQLAPLRERRGAVRTLAARFLGEFTSREGGRVAQISEEALGLLEEHDWPGNVRELRNVIERAVSVCPGDEIRPEDLPESVTRPKPWARTLVGLVSPGSHHSTLARSTLAQIKRDAELTRITEALQKHGNNRLRAAGELGISRMTLYKKLYKYGLMQPHAATRGGVA